MSESTCAQTGTSLPTGSKPEVESRWRKVVGRRSFLHGVGSVAAAGALSPRSVFATDDKLNPGDAALLQFAAAVEFVEADLWQQYNELGGAVDSKDQPNPGNPAYVAALSNLDSDMPQYISDNTDDEISHRDFLNAYLTSRGAQAVDFTKFRTVQGSTAMGSANTGRLTNLKTLSVDTSWYFRYRSTQNPDLGATFPQLLNITNQSALPLNNSYAKTTIQAIANVASIHFAFIEQGGSSLYPILSLKATEPEVLRIFLSIGGVEIDHFSLWHDKMGNAISQPVAPFTDSVTGLTFPDFNNAANQHNANLSGPDQAAGSQMFQTNLILPEPCAFLRPDLPAVSIIRPTLAQNGGAVATVKAFIADNLFVGQNPEFLEMFMDLASAADNVVAGNKDHGQDKH